MSTYQIHVFISHSWAYSGHYDTLEDWIFKRKWSQGQASLDLRDFSVPKNDPIHNASTDRALREAIYNQILTEVLHFALSAIRSRLSQDSLDL